VYPSCSVGCFGQREMGLVRIMHEEAHLLDGIGELGAGECQVL
jgi:hypothetical protein